MAKEAFIEMEGDRVNLEVPGAIARCAAAVGQLVLMATIVATLCYWHIGITIAVVLAAIGVPLDAFVSFGGAPNRYAEMAVWWLIFFAPALVYAALAFPWEQTRGFPPQRAK